MKLFDDRMIRPDEIDVLEVVRRILEEVEEGVDLAVAVLSECIGSFVHSNLSIIRRWKRRSIMGQERVGLIKVESEMMISLPRANMTLCKLIFIK